MEVKKIKDLVRELKSEAYFNGFHSALYNHMDGRHTVEKRDEMNNHRDIADKIESEIDKLLSEDAV